MSQKTIYFDIETAPLPDTELLSFMPEFEPAKNLKDPDKIKADLEQKKSDWLDKAALSAVTGKVVAVGAIGGAGFCSSCVEAECDEIDIISWLWDWMRTTSGDTLWVGFNCFGFDLPFLIRRSWKLGLDIPLSLKRGRYWGDWLVDAMKLWQLDEFRTETSSSLKAVAQFLGVGTKSGSGKDFDGLLKTDREKAVAYLKNDVELVKRIHEKMRL